MHTQTQTHILNMIHFKQWTLGAGFSFILFITDLKIHWMSYIHNYTHTHICRSYIELMNNEINFADRHWEKKITFWTRNDENANIIWFHFDVTACYVGFSYLKKKRAFEAAKWFWPCWFYIGASTLIHLGYMNDASFVAIHRTKNIERWNYDWLCNYFVKTLQNKNILTLTLVHIRYYYSPAAVTNGAKKSSVLQNPWSESNFSGKKRETSMGLLKSIY